MLRDIAYESVSTVTTFYYSSRNVYILGALTVKNSLKDDFSIAEFSVTLYGVFIETKQCCQNHYRCLLVNTITYPYIFCHTPDTALGHHNSMNVFFQC